MPKAKTVHELLINILMLNVGNISQIMEEKGLQVFGKDHLMDQAEIADRSVEFLELFVVLLQNPSADNQSQEYQALRYFFTDLSEQIQIRGGSLDEFVRYMQFLQNLFINDLEDNKLSAAKTREVLLLIASLFNDLTLDIFNVYLKQKESTIKAQEEEIKQTSTPIAEIWDGVLTLPIIGSLDSSRTMSIMEKLLTRIESDRAKVVVIDVTGVMAIDSQVAHHLIQMIRAISLMGAYPVLTGIRPDIARALTNLDIELGNVSTRATLSDGLKEAFQILGIKVLKAE